MQRQNEHVKLHVTIINSIFRHFDTPGGSDRQQNQNEPTQRQTFDARLILRKYAKFDFGKQPLTEIHLSRRYTTSASDGFYDATGIIKVLN